MSNRLLASTDSGTLARIRPKLVRVELALREVIYREDGPIEFAYFIESGMFSMVNNLADGMQAEAGLIGREGMTGISLISGVATSFIEAIVVMPGTALRMSARDLRHEANENLAFRTLLLRYEVAWQAQIMQTAACNRRHGLEQRLACWLLMSHDRVDRDDLPLTQEFIAMMLGVHRPSITVAARALQRADLIRYASGRVTIADRAGLEAASCECYSKVRRRFDTLLGSAALAHAIAPVAGVPPGRLTAGHQTVCHSVRH